MGEEGESSEVVAISQQRAQFVDVLAQLAVRLELAGQLVDQWILAKRRSQLGLVVGDNQVARLQSGSIKHDGDHEAIVRAHL